MDAKSFRTWLGQLDLLTPAQRRRASQALSPQTPPAAQAVALANDRARALHACPHCLGGHIQRWGRMCGVQRYRCCQCAKTFNALTGTALAHLKRRDAWLSYAKAMLDGLSVRAAARTTGVDRTTAFRWRHRLLQHPAEERDSELSTIVEADETYFLESFKGQRKLARPARHRGGHAAKRGLSAEQIPVLVMEDRQGHHFEAILPKADKPTLGNLLLQVLAPQSVLCSDGAGVYRALAREYAIVHESVNASAGEHVRQRVFHIQHVNAYDSRLKGWMRRFHGVATKYLPSYLGWRRLIERSGPNLSPELLLRHGIG